MCQTTLCNGKAPSGSVVGGGVEGCWTTTLPRKFCGRNTSKNKLVGSKP